MGGSNLVFSASDKTYLVFTCACGCDGCVKISSLDVIALNYVNGKSFYIAHHAPLGCDGWRKGPRYDFVASDASGSPQVESFASAGISTLPETINVSECDCGGCEHE